MEATWVRARRLAVTTMDASAPQEADGPPPFARLILDLRGVYFVIERETLMSLPESILLCLFPNGLVLPEGNPDETGDTTRQDEHVYHVDVRTVLTPV